MAPLSQLAQWGIDALITKGIALLVTGQHMLCLPLQATRQAQNLSAITQALCLLHWGHKGERGVEPGESSRAGMPGPDICAGSRDYVLCGKTHRRSTFLGCLTRMAGRVLKYLVSNTIDTFETIYRHPLKTAP